MSYKEIIDNVSNIEDLDNVTILKTLKDFEKYIIKNSKPGPKGDTGVTPNITATATTLPAGSEASVTKSGTAENPAFAFGIPKGDKGDKGEKGEKGDKGDTGGQMITTINATFQEQSDVAYTLSDIHNNLESAVYIILPYLKSGAFSSFKLYDGVDNILTSIGGSDIIIFVNKKQLNPGIIDLSQCNIIILGSTYFQKSFAKQNFNNNQGFSNPSTANQLVFQKICDILVD